MQQSDEPTDAALVAAVCAGDEHAFEQLFERHRRRVAHIAARFFSRPEQIEDIIQESFTKAYLALSDFAGAHAASFAAWLAQITVNTCYDELRRMQRRPEQQLDELNEAETHELATHLRSSNTSHDPEAALISRDLARKLLARLTPEDRLVLTLLDAEGLSVREIAQLTGWSAPKVKVRAHRARFLHLIRIQDKILS